MSELVSVVICSYNNWPDLELAIESALCQSHKPVEVIVVDNSSSDETVTEVPRRFGSRITFLQQANRGDSGAYNAGLAVARGDFIQFLDGDDILAPNKIERQLRIFREDERADVVFGNVRYFSGPAGRSEWNDFDSSERDIGVDQLIAREGGCVGAVLAVLFRRRAIERIGEWDESIYVSDSDYELRALLAGCPYRQSPGDVVAFKRVRPGQMGANPVAMLDGFEAFWLKALTLIRDERQRGAVRRNLARVRFFRAFRAENMSRIEALRRCWAARRTCPAAVSIGALAAASIVIALPGGRALARQPRFRDLRRAVAKLLGYRTVT